MAHSDCTEGGAGPGTVAGSTVYIAVGAGLGKGTGKYYSLLFTCPRNHSISPMCSCFDHLTTDVTSLIVN